MLGAVDEKRGLYKGYAKSLSASGHTSPEIPQLSLPSSTEPPPHLRCYALLLLKEHAVFLMALKT